MKIIYQLANMGTLLCLLTSCSQKMDSQLETVGYQPFSASKAIVLSIKDTNLDLFEQKEFIAKERPVYKYYDIFRPNKDKAKAKLYPFSHLPDYIEGIVPNKKIRMNIYTCREVDIRLNPEKCLNQEKGIVEDELFSAYDGQQISEAVLEAIRLLTFKDQVPVCYQELLRRTKEFEEKTPDFVKLRQSFFNMRKNPFYKDCGANPEKWINTRCAKLKRTYERLQKLFEKGIDENTIKLYELRYKLALRLGVDELDYDNPLANEVQPKENIDKHQEFLQGHRDLYFGCEQGKLGDKSCLDDLFKKILIFRQDVFNDDIVATTSWESSERQNFKDIQGKNSWMKADVRNSLAKFIWDAIRLTMISNLDPNQFIKDNVKKTPIGEGYDLKKNIESCENFVNSTYIFNTYGKNPRANFLKDYVDPLYYLEKIFSSKPPPLTQKKLTRYVYEKDEERDQWKQNKIFLDMLDIRNNVLSFDKEWWKKIELGKKESREIVHDGSPILEISFTDVMLENAKIRLRAFVPDFDEGFRETLTIGKLERIDENNHKTAILTIGDIEDLKQKYLYDGAFYIEICRDTGDRDCGKEENIGESFGIWELIFHFSFNIADYNGS